MTTRTHPAIAKASLLGLPQELRDKIYHGYFMVDGGYVYDGESDKLVQADGQPIDLSLRQSCRAIANETRDLPMNLNSIKFSTVYRKEWQQQATGIRWIVGFHRQLTLDMIVRLRRLVTPDMYHQSSPEHKLHMPFVQDYVKQQLIYDVSRANMAELRLSDDSFRIANGTSGLDQEYYLATWGWNATNMSSLRTAAHVLRLLAERYPVEFTETLQQVLPSWDASLSPLDFFDLTFAPWDIPSLPQITEVAEKLQLLEKVNTYAQWRYRDDQSPHYTGPKYRYRPKHRFSAASLAIRTLKRMTQRQRLSMRKLIINEDGISVAYSVVHPVGLIPFCKENPKLQIEHRVSLWRNLLIRTEVPTCGQMAMERQYPPLHDESDDEDDYEYDDYDDYDDYGSKNGSCLPHQVHRYTFANQFFELLNHVPELLELGMPSEAYTFLLDGDPDLNFSTTSLTTVFKYAVAWSTINTDFVAKGLFAPPESRQYPFMTRKDSEDPVSVKNRSSLIQCNFTLDQPWDINSIIEQYKIKPKADTLFRDAVGRSWYDVATPVLNLWDLKLELFEMEKRSDGTQ
ncbi:hypothetical protein ACHAP7_002914 [Fusarium lateritium]